MPIIKPPTPLMIGTAGWTIPGKDAEHFGEGASALARYATRFDAVEINSSFHRPHRHATWARWAESVPAQFRFAAKIPKTISHQRKLVDCDDQLASFLDEVGGLGGKLGVLLLQLPPKLAFDLRVVKPFLTRLAKASEAQLVCEPRHPSWFDAAADALLDRLHVARVAADPAIVPAASRPGGWRGFSYWRLHGSPAIYRSSYDDGRLDHYAKLLCGERSAGRPAWCMFDNTAGSAATADALRLARRLQLESP
jgi:uncharacterized protein YecE (DUF72 family)